MKFATTLANLRHKAEKSRYKLSQYSGIDESYILRLERDEKRNPSRNVVLLLGLALVQNANNVSMQDIEELLESAGYSGFRRRGDPLVPAA